MRQDLVLEAADLKALQSGETIMLHTPGGERLGLRLEVRGHPLPAPLQPSDNGGPPIPVPRRRPSPNAKQLAGLKKARQVMAAKRRALSEGARRRQGTINAAGPEVVAARAALPKPPLLGAHSERRHFGDDYKSEVVKLAKERKWSPSVVGAALGIHDSVVRQWMDK